MHRSHPAHARVALGIAQVPEGRQLFAPLSVEDNLKLGAWSRRVADIDAELGLRLRAVSHAGGTPRRDLPACCQAASSRCWRSARA
jgi:hypothetical protein